MKRNVICLATMALGAQVCVGAEDSLVQALSRSTRVPDSAPLEERAQATSVLTLADALVIAEQQNLRLRAAREEQEVADGLSMSVRSRAMPHLDFRAQYVRHDDVPSFEMQDGAFELGQVDNYEAVVEATQALYAGGALRAASRMAKANDRAVEGRIAHSRSELAYRIHALFNGVLLAKENSAVAHEAVQIAEQNLRDVQARLKQGMATRFDFLRAEEQVSSRASEKIAADNALRKAQLALLRDLELPFDDPREISGVLQFEPVDLSYSNAIAHAMANRHDLAAAERAVEMQREAAAIARAAGRPTLGLFGATRYGNPDRNFADEWEVSWSAGIRAEFPLFDGAEVRGKVRQETARLRQAELRRQDLVAQVKLELIQAMEDIETAAKLVEARRANVTQAEEALRLARRGYDQGIEQQIDVLSAQLSLTSSRRSLTAAVFEHVMARRRLERATGTLVTDDGK